MERTRRKSKTSKGRGTRRSGGRRRAWNKETGRERVKRRKAKRRKKNKQKLSAEVEVALHRSVQRLDEEQDRRRRWGYIEGRRGEGGEEEEGSSKRRKGETGGLVAATLRYDSRLSYPPHYLVLLPSLPPPFLPMLLLVPVSTPPSLRTNPSSPAQRRLSPLSADPRSAPTTSCLDGAYTDAANFAHRRTLARATVSCDSPSLSVRQSSLFHTTPISLTHAQPFSPSMVSVSFSLFLTGVY